MNEDLESSDVSHANSSQHNVVFAAWLVATYGQTYLRTGRGVVDVAGGGGLLSFELSVRWGVRSTVIDPRPAPLLKGMLRRRMRKVHKQRRNDSDKSPATSGEASGGKEDRDPLMAFVRQAVNGLTDDRVLEACAVACLNGETALPYKYLSGWFPQALDKEAAESRAEMPSLYTGMHADQATEATVDWALAAGRPFAVVPCCVFKSLFPHRQIRQEQQKQQEQQEGAPAAGGAGSVATYPQLVQHLQAKDTRIRSARLPYLGRNTVLYMLPADVEAPVEANVGAKRSGSAAGV